MIQQLEILILDMAGSSLLKQVKTFFHDEPVVLKIVEDLGLFETLANKNARFAMDMAIVLVDGSNCHLSTGQISDSDICFSASYLYIQENDAVLYGKWWGRWMSQPQVESFEF